MCSSDLVTDLAIGRLHDKGALVRKAAMGLLAALLGFNPFAPQLQSATFAESLKDYEAKLAAMTPPEEQNTGEVGEANADGENKGNDGETKEEDKQNPEGDANATIDLNGGLAGVRTMVAALKTALGFTVQLSGTVANLSNLLDRKSVV